MKRIIILCLFLALIVAFVPATEKEFAKNKADGMPGELIREQTSPSETTHAEPAEKRAYELPELDAYAGPERIILIVEEGRIRFLECSSCVACGECVNAINAVERSVKQVRC